jgi:hypothetical protein
MAVKAALQAERRSSAATRHPDQASLRPRSLPARDLQTLATHLSPNGHPQNAEAVLSLQRTIGNAAVQRLLRDRAANRNVPDASEGMMRPSVGGRSITEAETSAAPPGFPAAPIASPGRAGERTADKPMPAIAEAEPSAPPPGSPVPPMAPPAREGERTAEKPAPEGARGTKPAPAGAGGTKPAPATAEAEAVQPRKARDPRQAIAPTVGAIRQRAGVARHYRPANEPVAHAEAAGTDPGVAAMRVADHRTIENVDAAARQSDEVKPTFRSKLKETLEKAINTNMQQPKTKSEADTLMQEGAKRANQSLGGQLATQRQAATGPVTSAVGHPVEAPKGSKPAPELHPEQGGPPPAPIAAAPAVPAPLPAEQLDYSSDRAPTDKAMAENDVTKQQLEEGNEPAFGQALSARSEAERHEATAEARYRQSETRLQAGAQGAAQQALAQGLASIHDARSTRIAGVAGQQRATKDKDADARKAVTDKIAQIKNQTLKEVNDTLNGLEQTATKIFADGLQRAEEVYNDAFEEAKGGAWTWLTTWGEEWTEHIENSLRKAKAAYKNEVDRAIDEVADFVEAKLSAAKRSVAKGLQEVENYVNGLDHSVKEFAQSALKEVSADFAQMVSDIDNRAEHLVDKLTEQYRASYQRMEAMEEKLREENKSLWQRVYDATVGLIEKIIAFKDMLLGILGRAASVIGDIIKHPIRFLGNLVDAVKRGISNFVSRIGEHLKQGLLEWLFGEVASAGIQLPKSFDLKGIVSLVLQVLGLTYANFRARAVALLGEKVVASIEKVAEIFRKVVTEGPAALWEWIKEKLGDLQSLVLDQIRNFIITKVIVAGVTWLIGLLNPASAFFKACKAIYDIIMFFVERGSQIIALVNAIIGSLTAIASGAIGGAAAMVENALARAIPVVISFLASLLGIGGLGEKIKSIIETVRKPVNAAIDWVIGKAVTLVKAAGTFVAGRFGGGKKEEEKKEEADPQKAARLETGLAAIDAADQARAKQGKITRADAEAVAAEVRRTHPIFKSLTIIARAHRWDYRYSASPEETHPGEEMAEGEQLQSDNIWDQVLAGVSTQPTRETRLDETSVRHGLSQIEQIFARESVAAVEADEALRVIGQLAERALAESTGDAISRRMRSISGVANSALRAAGSGVTINAHHIEQVSKHVGTFPETKRERTYIPVKYRRAIDKWIEQNQHLSSTKIEENKAIFIKELQDQLFEERYPNLEAALSEVQMVITTATAHSAGHRIIATQAG